MRVLAAMIVANGDEFGGDDLSAMGAVDILIDAIDERIGKRGVWLNALSLIGKRIGGAIREGFSGGLYRADSVAEIRRSAGPQGAGAFVVGASRHAGWNHFARPRSRA